MITRSELRRERELGDFQTPSDLVEAVLDVIWDRRIWTRVLEPTCGKGNFLAAICRRATRSGFEIKGIEIQPEYVDQARKTLSEHDCDATVTNANLFGLDTGKLSWRSSGPLLVIGNPPWITNSELGTLGSANLPEKSNFKGLQGFAARTGAANFDIAEFIILKLVDELQGQPATIAFLCKTIVARNVIEYAAKAALPVAGASMHTINAQRSFGAAVDACLFSFDVAPPRRFYEAATFDSLQSQVPRSLIRVVNGTVVADAVAHEESRAIDGVSPIEWRQGVKHDAASVMELRLSADGWMNGEGEQVDVEDEFVFPLAKATTVFRGRVPNDRAVIVTQRSLSEDTARLEASAPKLWNYLKRHLATFQNRKSSIYLRRSQFSMFGIGAYTFAPFKVAISGMHKEPNFRLFAPLAGKPVVFDDTCYFMPFDDPEEAAVVAAALQSHDAKALLRAITFRDAKRPITKKVLQRIALASMLKPIAREGLLPEAAQLLKESCGHSFSQEGFAHACDRLIRGWILPTASPAFEQMQGSLL